MPNGGILKKKMFTAQIHGCGKTLMNVSHIPRFARKCFRATQLENDNNRFIIFYPLKAAARTDHFKEAIRMFQW